MCVEAHPGDAIPHRSTGEHASDDHEEQPDRHPDDLADRAGGPDEHADDDAEPDEGEHPTKDDVTARGGRGFVKFGQQRPERVFALAVRVQRGGGAYPIPRRPRGSGHGPTLRHASSMRSAALGLVVALALAPALAAPAYDHVCAPDESKATCPTGRVRLCAKDGSLAACGCPPGATATASTSACIADGKPPPSSGCLVPDTTLPKQLGAELELSTLAQPALSEVGVSAARAELLAFAKKAPETAIELRRMGDAAEVVEADEARSLGKLQATKPLADARARRDRALDDSIAARRSFVKKYPADAASPIVRLALGRALLRRASYTGVGPVVDLDRAAARAELELVAARPELDVPRRDAAFVLGELAIRAGEWTKAVGYEEIVRKAAASKADADDPPYAAAASARVAQAKLALGDLDGGRRALDETIGLAAPCIPRAECVSASAGARKVLAATYAALSMSPRTMVPVLTKAGNIHVH